MILVETPAEEVTKVFPNSTDGRLQELAGKVSKYEHKQCIQHMVVGGAFYGVFSPDFRMGVDRIGQRLPKPSHVHEFPWVNTGGFEGRAEHYVYLPPGKSIEVVDRTGRTHPQILDTQRFIQWRYPEGTTFVETLDTHGYVFEVRTRVKTKDGTWRSQAYRPYSDANDLVKKLESLGSRDAKAFAKAIRNPKREYLEIRNPHPHKTFEFKGYREELPEIPEALAKVILGWDFEPMADWRGDCHAPTTKSDKLHIVPKNYAGFMVRPDSKGCMQCHDTTGLDSGLVEMGRDWYGHIRGMDGIFSFHIFDGSCIGKGEVRFNHKLPLKQVNGFTK